MSEQKEFIGADRLVEDSFELARRIYDSGYGPQVLLVLWRGGTPVGIVVHEYLRYRGIETYHTVVKAESYLGIGRRIDPRIEGLDAVLEAVPRDDRVLVIDDIFDTGCTMSRVCEAVRRRTRHVRAATLYYKTGRNRTGMEPDFFVRKTPNWIVFPHELVDLTADEIRRKGGRIYDLVVGSGGGGC